MMKNTADVINRKPVAVWSQSISDASAVNPLVAFYDIHVRKREVLFFYFVPDTTLDITLHYFYLKYCSGSSKQNIYGVKWRWFVVNVYWSRLGKIYTDIIKQLFLVLRYFSDQKVHIYCIHTTYIFFKVTLFIYFCYVNIFNVGINDQCW
jgi:hypothetical protein